MQGPFLRKYGVQTTVLFDLFEVDGVDFRVDAVHAAGDTKITKDEGAEANTTNGFTDEGQGYSLVLSATEMQAARIKVYVVDQTATKVWLDTSIVIETYGNASAMHAMDLDEADGSQFTEAGGTGDHLTAINLPNQTMDITGNITGNLSGSVGSVTGNVGGTVNELAAQAKADVNAEVVDALATDTYAEPGQGAPAATTTLAAKINYLYKAWRNKKINDGSTVDLYDDAGTTVDQKRTISDDGSTFTEGEVASGP